MGTKNNPGRYDCYDRAEPDEPIFVLLGRDRHAVDLIRQWAARRLMEIHIGIRPAGGDDEAQAMEALQCTVAMMNFNAKRELAQMKREGFKVQGNNDQPSGEGVTTTFDEVKGD